MPTQLPSSIPTSVDTVEKLVVYAIELYNRVAAGRYYSERSDSDRRPFMQVSIDDAFAPENDTRKFMIFRGAVPLNPDFATSAETIWETAPGLTGSITVPAGFSG